MVVESNDGTQACCCQDGHGPTLPLGPRGGSTAAHRVILPGHCISE